MGYVADIQVRHMNPQNFKTFEEKKVHNKNNISKLSHVWEIETPYFFLIPFDFKYICK